MRLRDLAAVLGIATLLTLLVLALFALRYAAGPP